MKGAIILCLSLYILGANAGAASFIEPCLWSDKDCIMKSTKKALPIIAAGVPELGMESLDPLHIQKVDGDVGDLKLKFEDMVVKRLSECEFAKIERTDRKKAELTIHCPIVATGNYVLGGKLLFLDVSGNGPFEITTERIKVSLSIDMEDVNKDGKDYYKFTKYDYSYEPDQKFYFKFDNLFNGDESQAGPVNKLFNDSWKEILDVCGQPVLKSIVAHVVKNISKLFGKVPHDQLEIHE